MSADSIVKFPDIFASATVTSVGKAPAAILDVARESLFNLPAIVADETLAKSSAATGCPPCVEPSCTTGTSLSVSIVTSPSAPVKLPCCVVVPRLSFNNFAI